MQLKVGESIKFTLVGKAGNETINITQADWSTIHSDVYFIGDGEGNFTITATIEDVSNYGFVSVVTVTEENTVNAETSKF